VCCDLLATRGERSARGRAAVGSGRMARHSGDCEAQKQLPPQPRGKRRIPLGGSSSSSPSPRPSPASGRGRQGGETEVPTARAGEGERLGEAEVRSSASGRGRTTRRHQGSLSRRERVRVRGLRARRESLSRLPPSWSGHRCSRLAGRRSQARRDDDPAPCPSGFRHAGRRQPR